MYDLLFSAQLLYNRTHQVIPLLMVATLWYIAVTTVLNVGQYSQVPERLWQRLESIDGHEFTTAVAGTAVLVAAAAADGHRAGGRSGYYQEALDGFGLHAVARRLVRQRRTALRACPRANSPRSSVSRVPCVSVCGLVPREDDHHGSRGHDG